MITLLLLISFLGIFVATVAVAFPVILVGRFSQKITIERLWSLRWAQGHGLSKLRTRRSSRLLSSRVAKSWKKNKPYNCSRVKCSKFRARTTRPVVYTQVTTTTLPSFTGIDGKTVFPLVWDPTGEIVAETIVFPTTINQLVDMMDKGLYEFLCLRIGGEKMLEDYANSLMSIETDFAPKSVKRIEVVMASKNNSVMVGRQLSLNQCRVIDKERWENRTIREIERVNDKFRSLCINDRLHEAVALCLDNAFLMAEESESLSIALFERGKLRLKRGQESLAILDMSVASDINCAILEEKI